MNKAAQKLGRLGRGKKKTLTAAERERRDGVEFFADVRDDRLHGERESTMPTIIGKWAQP